MNEAKLFEKYFTNKSALEMVLEHSRMVAAKAVRVAESLGCSTIDVTFVEEAALLHDIGVCQTASAAIGCRGNEPYIRHGIIGRAILEAEGMPRHALVCERHIGVGLTIDDIRAQNLPLPEREMLPVSTEERIICFADLFFSKYPGAVHTEKSPEAVRAKLAQYGAAKVRVFDQWLGEFVCPT